MSHGTLTKSVGMQKTEKEAWIAIWKNLLSMTFRIWIFFLCLAAEAGSSSSRLPVSVTSVRNCFFHWPHKHVVLRRSVLLRPEPLRTKVKTSLPPRKAFSAVLCSVNVKIPPSSDKTAATAASALIFSQAHNRLPAFLFLLLLFFWGAFVYCSLQLPLPGLVTP